MNSSFSLSNTIAVVRTALPGRAPAISRIAARINVVSRHILRDRRGTTALEYALIAAITAMVAVVGMVSVGGGANASLHLLSNAVEPAAAPSANNSAAPSGAPGANPAPDNKASPGSGTSTTTVP